MTLVAQEPKREWDRLVQQKQLCFNRPLTLCPHSTYLRNGPWLFYLIREYPNLQLITLWMKPAMAMECQRQ